MGFRAVTQVRLYTGECSFQLILLLLLFAIGSVMSVRVTIVEGSRACSDSERHPLGSLDVAGARTVSSAALA